MGEVERPNPRWGLDLSSHSGRAGVATRFAGYENVSRTWCVQVWTNHSPAGNTPSLLRPAVRLHWP